MKDDLQIQLRQEEQLLRTQLLHKQTIQRLELKRRKLLLLHVLEQNLFEDVRTHSSFNHLLSLFFFSFSIEMHKKYGFHRSKTWPFETTSRTNERIRIETIDEPSQVENLSFTFDRLKFDLERAMNSLINNIKRN